MWSTSIDTVLKKHNAPDEIKEKVYTTLNKIDYNFSINAYSDYNKVKVIMATTEAEKNTVIKMMKLGANGYLVKPFNPDAIKNSLRPIVARMGIDI